MTWTYKIQFPQRGLTDIEIEADAGVILLEQLSESIVVNEESLPKFIEALALLNAKLRDDRKS